MVDLEAKAAAIREDPTQGHVFATILTRGPLSRRDVARLTGLSASTVTKAVKPLLAAGYLVEGAEEIEGPGRPITPLTVNTERHYVLGVKVMEHEAVGVVADPQGRVLASLRRPLRERTVDGLLDDVAQLTDALRAVEPEF